MDATFYGNTLTEYAVAAGATAGILVLIIAVQLLVARKLHAAHTTASELDDLGLGLTQRTKILLLILPAVYLGFRGLSIPADIRRTLQQAATLSLIAQGALWCSAVVDFWLRRYQRSRMQVEPEAVTTINAFRIAALAAIWAVAVLSAIANLGFDITALIAGMGIGGVAVALATQSILGDIFASLSIVLDKPFVVGDFIVVNGAAGTVEHIGLKTTQIRALSGEQLILGNGDLLKSRIHNYKRMVERRVVFRIGVVYQTAADTLEKIPSMIRAVIEQQAKARVERIHFMSFADSALEFETVYWVTSPDYNDYADTQQAINLGIVRAFENAGIGFAYPTRTLHIESSAAGAEGSAAHEPRRGEPAPC